LRRIFLAYYVSLYTLDLSRKMSGQKLVEYSVNKGKPSQGIGTLGTVFLQLPVLDLVFSIYYRLINMHFSLDF
jgi:hypothetical protein